MTDTVPANTHTWWNHISGKYLSKVSATIIWEPSENLPTIWKWLKAQCVYYVGFHAITFEIFVAFRFMSLDVNVTEYLGQCSPDPTSIGMLLAQ